MKAELFPITLQSAESFTCVDWRVPDREEQFPFTYLLDYLLVGVMESRGTAYIGDHIRPFREGDIFLFAPRLPLGWTHHAEKSRPTRHILTASFGEEFAHHAFRTPEAGQIRRMLARSRRGILFPRHIFARVMPDLLRVSQLKGWPRMALFLDVLGRLAAARDIHLLASPGFSAEINEKDLGRLSAVCHYVHASYAEEIREKDASALVGLSPAPFSRFFRGRMGCTFITYVNKVRIDEACRRLAETDLTIVQIAFESGFHNLSNFNRNFQKLMGMTPREYRSRNGAILPTATPPPSHTSRRK